MPLQAPDALAPAVQRSQAQRAAEIKLDFDTTHSIRLGNVQVSARRVVTADSRRLYPISQATVLRMDDYPTARNSSATVLQMLQSRVPGVSVTGTEPNMHVLIRGVNSLSGSSEPLFLLDGVPVTADALAYYPAADVETVEILKGAQAGIYGSRASGGVVAVYTRRGSPAYNPKTEQAPGVLALRVPGYACSREFYAPRYHAAP
ncbi:TonB-dependent receptor plug domain-containing protein, partial [Hymenobacter agri]